MPFLLHPSVFPMPDEPIVGAATVHHLFKGWLAGVQRGELPAAVEPAGRTHRPTPAAADRELSSRWTTARPSRSPGSDTRRTLIDVDGYRVITDPLLTRRVAHLRRRRDAPVATTADVDVALLSHIHLDHIHLPSIRKLRPIDGASSCRATPAPLLRKAGFDDVTEVVEGDVLEVGPLRVEVVHAEHKAGRGPHTKLTASPLGFIVDTDQTGEHHGKRVYYPGDTDLFDGMAIVRRRRPRPAADLGVGIDARHRPPRSAAGGRRPPC